MMLTAFSHGRMSTLYPFAGSAYACAGRGLNSHAGFLVGWAMGQGYLAIPIINTIYAALALKRPFPEIASAALAVLVVRVTLFLNLR